MRRILRPAPFAYRGMCELFEMFLLMTFNTFSEVSLTDLLNEQLPQVCRALPAGTFHIPWRIRPFSGFLG